MGSTAVKVKSIQLLNQNVLKVETERPEGFSFNPGQAADISLNKDGWRDTKKPFSFTSLPSDNYLQFTIKVYESRNGLTKELLNLRKDDELILYDVFGAIEYKGEGFFIAGGAGVTPFISILRFLQSRNELGSNKLIFANRTRKDIILDKEFRTMLGSRFINILSDDIIIPGVPHGFITEEFLRSNISDLNKFFYLCGPPQMMKLVEKILSDMNIDESLIIKESL
jgi:ferredoxin-NADP reductase